MVKTLLAEACISPNLFVCFFFRYTFSGVHLFRCTRFQVCTFSGVHVFRCSLAGSGRGPPPRLRPFFFLRLWLREGGTDKKRIRRRPGLHPLGFALYFAATSWPGKVKVSWGSAGPGLAPRFRCPDPVLRAEGRLPGRALHRARALHLLGGTAAPRLLDPKVWGPNPTPPGARPRRLATTPERPAAAFLRRGETEGEREKNAVEIPISISPSLLDPLVWGTERG